MEKIEEIIKRKYHLKEEDIKEIISLIKENNNSPISSEDELLIEEMNQKYAGKIVYCNHYEDGGWICYVDKIILDNGYDIRFQGERIELLSCNHFKGDGLIYVDGYDDGIVYDYDPDNEDLEILDSIEDVKEIINNIQDFFISEIESWDNRKEQKSILESWNKKEEKLILNIKK